MNLNKAILIGNLTRDPEMRSLPSGQPVTTLGIATNRVWKDQSGARQTATDFHNVVLFGRLAEIAKQYLTKGKMVMIEGRIQNRSWEGKDGVKRYRTEIVANSMQMGPRGSNSNVQENPETPKEEPVETIQYPGDDGEINPDEIPF